MARYKRLPPKPPRPDKSTFSAVDRSVYRPPDIEKVRRLVKSIIRLGTPPLCPSRGGNPEEHEAWEHGTYTLREEFRALFPHVAVYVAGSLHPSAGLIKAVGSLHTVSGYPSRNRVASVIAIEFHKLYGEDLYATDIKDK